MNTLEKISLILNRTLIWIAGFILGGMILLTCANIFLRLVWMPVRGTYELMGYAGAVVTAFALGYTQIKKGHIAVDILVKCFSERIQKIIGCINSAICLIFFSLASWQIVKIGTNLLKTGETSETLRIVYYPFTYGVALGCFVLVLVMLVEFLKHFASEKETG
ncbi:MAG: TRAP transporter small permease [Deltaproteobacteria bacterium]|nr:TRAP transporter small permease [Deltaproteobacteria bacterium]